MSNGKQFKTGGVNSSGSLIYKYNLLQSQINALTGTYPPVANIVTTDTAQTISGLKTFTTLPQSSVVPVSATDLANKAYVDGKVVSTPTLAQVLTAGNKASTAIDMSGNNITGANQITATTFFGSLTGNATSATNATNAVNATNATTSAQIATTGVSTNSNYYIPFVASTASSSGQVLYTDVSGHITFNPSTNQLSTDGKITCGNGLTMNGSASQLLINNASASVPAISAPNAQLISFPSANVTALKFIGDLSGNATSSTTTTTATKATNVVIQSTASAGTYYPVFVDGTTGNRQATTNSVLSYNPSTNTLTCSNLTGTASNATTATNATNVATTATSTNATYYPTFVSATSGNNAINVDTTLTYNPSTDTLTCANLTGTASSATTATNATNVGITSDNTSGTYYIPFVKTTGTGNKPLFIDDTTTPLTYNPSTASLVVNQTSSNSTLGGSSLVIANSGGTLTINQAQFSTTATTSTFNAGSTQNLQINGTTLAQLQSTAFSLLNGTTLSLYDTASHAVNISSTWFGTAGVQYTNLVPVATGSGVNGTVLNIGAVTNSSNTTTKTPYGTINTYSTSNYTYTSATDGTPLLLTGSDGINSGSKTFQLATTNTAQNTAFNINNNNTNWGSGCRSSWFSGSSGSNNDPSFYTYTYNPTTSSQNAYIYLKKATSNLLTLNPNVDAGVVAGFQTSVGTSGAGGTNCCAELFYNPDQYGSSTSNTTLRLNDNGLTYGLAVDSLNATPAGQQNPTSFGSTYLTINSSGITTPTTLQLPTTSTALNFSGSVAINGQSKTFGYFTMNPTGTTNTISGLSFVNMPLNASYTVAIYNQGSGNFTINAISGIRTNFTTSFVVPTGRYATLIIRYLYFGASSYYCLEATLLQTN
jgi:hypothetical protein